MADDAFVGDFPVLRIRGGRGGFSGITEVRLGGVDLIPFGVTQISLSAHSSELTTATITFEVVPDIEVPAAVMLTPKSEVKVVWPLASK